MTAMRRVYRLPRNLGGYEVQLISTHGDGRTTVDAGPLGEITIPYAWLEIEEQPLPTCCDTHNRNCEPPGDLCCGDCTEAAHDTFPFRHADGSRCVLHGQVGDE